MLFPQHQVEKNAARPMAAKAKPGPKQVTEPEPAEPPKESTLNQTNHTRILTKHMNEI